MKVVVFSEALQFFKMASALAQSLTEDTVGVFTQKVNFTRKLYLADKVEEDGLVDFRICARGPRHLACPSRSLPRMPCSL
ncbi:MAG: electron transfer flavoprotein subunit alpha [Candidatus Aramenus sulfurataquae]|jgi:hypothetical protein|uniref:Electron transfer flavoprotein subunit alpha n=2 Tax=Candidatus Aramenus sulfurataquae TaxID=1326980 RepID=W7KNN5_9CREN|nr:MAG: electron transfer flavoprotein subunit alpha [Candidatus Aramenus sulfurataquae]MCL7343852.1 hypothetical protein [Candidatus Aramenus sulfurataquae]